MSIRIGILGYGNLGRGVECAIKHNPDLELVAVFTRRAPETVKILTETATVYSVSDAEKMKDKIDVLIICGGSATDLPKQTPEYAKMFNVIDSFDTHARIPEHFAEVDAAAKKSGKIGLISVGWDPGMFSLNRLYANAILPEGNDYTFWGIGAYTAAILSTRYNVGMGVCMILAAVIAGIFSLLLGLATLRLKGYFLTIVTLGFCEIIRLVELNSMELTRGPLGIANIPAPNFFGVTFSSTNAVYYIMLILVVLTVLLVYNFVHSRIGLAVMSIRDDDLAAASMGVNVYLYKIMVFVISAMIMGVCGAFYAHYIKFVDPSSFTTNASMQMLIMAIFGGLGSIPGTILGASILTILPETIRVLSQYRNLIYGIIIVVLMMVKPDGLLGSVNFKYIKQRLMLKKEKQHEKGAANE